MLDFDDERALDDNTRRWVMRKLVGKALALKRLLRQTRTPPPTVVYVHCIEGVNRSVAAVTAYLDSPPPSLPRFLARCSHRLRTGSKERAPGKHRESPCEGTATMELGFGFGLGLVLGLGLGLDAGITRGESQGHPTSQKL